MPEPYNYKGWKRQNAALFLPPRGPVRAPVINRASGEWPAGVPRLDWWFDANSLKLLGVANGGDVGTIPGTNEWIDRESAVILRENTGFEPHFDENIASFGNGTQPGVNNQGASPDFELLKPYTPITSFDMPLSAVGNDPCSYLIIGRVLTFTSVIGDENTDVNASNHIGFFDNAADTIVVVNGNSANLTLATITGVQAPFNTICIISKRSSTDWNTWHNGTKIGSGVGTFGQPLNHTRILRARGSSGGQPLGEWTCRHFGMWNSVGITDSQADAVNNFFNAQLGVY